MKILSAKQIQHLDACTIKQEPVSSLALMERAAEALCTAIVSDFGTNNRFIIFCGPGNNGGDGFALARLLKDTGAKVQVFEVKKDSQKLSKDANVNKTRYLIHDGKHEVLDEHATLNFSFDPEAILVDALFGSGLNRMVEGHFAQVTQLLNKLPNTHIAIDIPSGLFADDNAKNKLEVVCKADITYTLQTPKFSFFHRETAPLVGVIHVLPIGLDSETMETLESNFYQFERTLAQNIYTPRSAFSYKNTFGHALLLAGTKNTMGAAFLSAKACMRAGVGLLTVNLPKGGAAGLNLVLPEAMLVEDKNEQHLTELPNTASFQAIGFGMGLGQSTQIKQLLKRLLKAVQVPLLLDADALNLLANSPSLLKKLPAQTILTPHIGEFKRLLKIDSLGYDYLEKAAAFAKKYGIILVLKDTITTVFSTDGKAYFINEGSAALATSGSGDVLSGVITALLANGYKPLDAACLGVYIHAKAGKLAGEVIGLESTLAGDIPEFIGEAYRTLIN